MGFRADSKPWIPSLECQGIYSDQQLLYLFMISFLAFKSSVFCKELDTEDFVFYPECLCLADSKFLS